MPKKPASIGGADLLLYAYLAFLLGLWSMRHWPEPLWGAVSVIEMAPLWVLLVPLVVFIPFVFTRPARAAVLLLSAVLTVFGIMGFNIPFGPGKADGTAVKILSVNLGHVDQADLVRLVVEERPDVIAFQEGGHLREDTRRFLEVAGFPFKGDKGLMIASRLKARVIATKDRRPYGGWGGIVALFEVSTGDGRFYLANAHLETPREGIEALLSRRMEALSEMRRVTDIRMTESEVASNFVSRYQPLIITGDFNMPVTDPIFRTYWLGYRDAFGERGIGFGYTKHTRWHGARIDLILCDQSSRVIDARVGPDIGGDHHPVLATIAIHPVRSAADVAGAAEGAARADRVGPGSERAVPTGPAMEGEAGRIPKVDEWPLEPLPVMKLSYRLVPGAPLVLRVRTQYGDWLCLGESPAGRCPDKARVKSVAKFTDDGAWHDMEINVKTAVESILPMVKKLTALEFLGAEVEGKRVLEVSEFELKR